MDENGFYRSAAWYDLGYHWASDDIQFWLSLAEQLDAKRVLELGCGTGRVTVPLARWGAARGLRIVGLDLLPLMLAGAEEKLAAEPEAVRAATDLVVGDMRAFTLDERFDLIFVPFNTLGHLHALDEQLACLRAARCHLARGGRFVVDVVWPSVEELYQATCEPGSAHVDGASIDQEAGTRLVRYRRSSYAPATQTMVSRFTDERLGATGERTVATSTLSLHVYSPREIELLFRLAGYRVEAIYGDYAGGPLTEASLQMIVVGTADDERQ